MREKSNTYSVTVTKEHNPEGVILLREDWRLGGQKNAGSDRPTVVVRHADTGTLLSEQYFNENGERHRSGQPAYIEYDCRGRFVWKHWYFDGKPHRIDGPSRLDYDSETGVVVLEAYEKHGLLHRDNGPAILYRDPETGMIKEQAWYRDGQRVQPPSCKSMPKLEP